MPGSHLATCTAIPERSMNPMPTLRWHFALVLALITTTGWTMGLRSFVALPVDKGGTVLRVQGERNNDRNVNRLIASAAYGLSGKHTLLFGLPYRISPGGGDRLGDLSVLYRPIVWQVDAPARTSRLGLLGGVVVPGDSDRDFALQGGAVATFYRGRYGWDVDVLYQAGLDDRPNQFRYDLSWQYRLTPAEYPEWGIGSEWDGVLELGGRYREGNSVVHQATAGLQWIRSGLVLEGGVTRDLNGPGDTRILISMRVHFSGR